MLENEERPDVSVIIPIFNQKSQLQKSIKGLLREQTNFCKIELLLVNDGSTDGSGEVCQSLANKYSEIRYFEQNNRGVSAARNQGIRNARGKYLFYIDADDRVEPGTISKIKSFFDTVEHEVELVTYRIDTIYDGKRLMPHFRYQYLIESGVYDLTEYAYIGQTTMNIVVKNHYEQNILFDEKQTFSEDQKYCCQVLQNTLKMGFCAEGRYIYYRSPNSASGRLSGACYVFEQCTALFEEVFSWYKDEVPAAFQGLYINDFYWKLCCNILYPHHYVGEEYEKAVGRLLALLRRCSNKILLEHPNIDFFEKYYMLRLKGPDAMEWRIRTDGFGLFYQDICTLWESSVEIVMTKCAVRGNKVIIEGFLKTVFFQFYDQLPILYAIENGGRTKRKISLKSSAHSYYLSHEKTQRFWTFNYECMAEQVQRVRFEMRIEDKRFPVHYYFMPCVPFSHKYQRYEYYAGSLRLFLDERNELHIYRVATVPHRALWLYYDCTGVPCDNGMSQFLHDYRKEDGIERYYIVSDPRQWDRLPNRKCGVVWGSWKHKRLFRKCEKILTAYIEESNIIPYPREQYDLYAGDFRWEVVYLQHGVLHIDMPWKYSPERILADRVVVSTEQEAGLYEKNGFHRQALLKCRMPRLAVRSQNMYKGKRILYAPSWRSYLVGKYGQSHRWERMDKKFETSNYYCKILELLKAEKLQELLEQYDLELDLKLHPIFEIYREYFDDLPQRIHVIDQAGQMEEYTIFITDFSSYLYDYLFAGIPVFLYLPDKKEFRCGMNGYREMGEEVYWDKLNTEPGGLIQQIRLYLDQGSYDGIRANFYESGEPVEEIYQNEMALRCSQQEGDTRMISVVIPYSEDKTYLRRCLSMIKRQTCKDIEIILITDDCPPELADEYSLNLICCESEAAKYHALNQALDMAKGDYIFFLKISSVCAENTLEELQKAIDDNKDCFPYTSCYCEQESKLTRCGDILMSLYGRLFKTAVIQEHNIRFNEASILAEAEFVLTYMCLYSSIQLVDDLEIYETESTLADIEEDNVVTLPEWKNILSKVHLLEDPIRNLALEQLCQMVDTYHISSYELLVATEEELHEAYELNYKIAKPILEEWWAEIKDSGDEELFIKLQSYLALFEKDEDFLSLLMYTCGLTREQYCYIKNNKIDKALYFLKQTMGKSGQQVILQQMISPLKKEIEDLRESVYAIETDRSKNENKNLGGVELAQFTVDGYSNGKLGFQTIYKSFRAWLKYKFK